MQKKKLSAESGRVQCGGKPRFRRVEKRRPRCRKNLLSPARPAALWAVQQQVSDAFGFPPFPGGREVASGVEAPLGRK